MTVLLSRIRSLPQVSAPNLIKACRTFSRSFPIHQQSLSPSSSSSASPSITKDPSHPNLYYHTFPHPPPGRIALTFLPQPPSEGSKSVLGYLPLEGARGLEDLQEEPRFLDVLHESIKSGLARGRCPQVDFEAEMRPGDGYIHITDERAVPPAGRIGETDDIIGSCFVQDGKVVVSTYERFPSYRLVTSNGPLVLPKGLAEHLIEELHRIDSEEKTA